MKTTEPRMEECDGIWGEIVVGLDLSWRGVSASDIMIRCELLSACDSCDISGEFSDTSSSMALSSSIGEAVLYGASDRVKPR